MKHDTADWIRQKVNRRGFLRIVGATGATTLLVGCGYYEAYEGDAYAPWSDLEFETRPAYLAAAAATLASNPHNTQPWLFEITDDRIDLYADMSRSLGAMDSLHREMFIGLGCAIENAVVAANASGKAVSVQLMPDGPESDRAAILEFTDAPATDVRLFDALPNRHTNRGSYLDAPIPGLERAMAGVIDSSVVSLTTHVEGHPRQQFIDGTIDATIAIIDDDEMVADSDKWWRASKAEIDEHRDGVTIDASGKGSSIRALGKIFPTSAEQSHDYWLASTRAEHATGSAFCVLSTPNRNDRVEQLLCGRAYQRLHLWLTAEGLAAQPLNQMPERQDREETAGLEPEFTNRLAELVQPTGWGAQMLFRVGVPTRHAKPAPRRPLEWVTT